MDLSEERNMSEFFLLVAGVYGFYLTIGWLLRFASQNFIYSEVVLMQASPWSWSWFYNVPFSAWHGKIVVALIGFSIVDFVLYLLVLYLFFR